MIEAIDLYKAFGDARVLEGASFTVPAGTVTALVGPNGSGKTTTLHLLAGLATPDAGTARIDGIDVGRHRRAAQAKLAFLPQDVRFHDALTPRHVLRFYANLRGCDADRVDPALGCVDLRAAADQPCGTLSGGMRQRLGLALLALADADVLLLDEPALSLDPDWRTHLMRWLRECADTGVAVLMTTHLLDIWHPIVDRVLTCTAGAIRVEDAVSATEAQLQRSTCTPSPLPS